MDEAGIDRLSHLIAPLDQITIRAMIRAGMEIHAYSVYDQYSEITMSNETSLWTIQLQPNLKKDDLIQDSMSRNIFENNEPMN